MRKILGDFFWDYWEDYCNTVTAAVVGWPVGSNLKNYINSFLNYDIKSFVFFKFRLYRFKFNNSIC